MVFLKHYDYIKTTFNFNQRPYYKLFYTFISLLDNIPNDAKVFNSENKKIKYMNLIAEFLKIPSPSNYPGFALAWLYLFFCKPFISCFLGEIESPAKEKNKKVLENYLYLIMDLFVFLKNCGNYNYNKYTSKIFMDNLYKFMFLLSNSYPEFISGYYYNFIISIPPKKIKKLYGIKQNDYKECYKEIKNLLSNIEKGLKINDYNKINQDQIKKKKKKKKIILLKRRKKKITTKLKI